MAQNAVVSLIVRGRDMTSGAFKKAGAGLSKMKAQALSLNAALAAIGVTVAVAVGKKLVASFGRQERAILRVKQSLANAGIFSDELTKKLETNAAALQRVTQAGDEAILEATATVADLAKELEGEDFLKVQQAVIALADTFFDGNLRTAGIMLSKTLGSSINALARYGVEIDTSATQGEKLNQVLAITAGMFETSKAAATDVLGVTAQLANSYGDLQEALGGVLVETLNLRSETDGLRSNLDAISGSITRNESKWIRWGRIVVAVISAVVQTLIFPVRALLNLGQMIGDTMAAMDASGEVFWAKMFDKIPGVERDIESLEKVATAAWASLRGDTEDLTSTVLGLGQSYRDVIAAIQDTTVASSRQEFTPTVEDPFAGFIGPEQRSAVGSGLQRGPGALNLAPTLFDPALLVKVNTELQVLLSSFGSLEEMLAGSALQAVQGLGDAFGDAFQAGIDGSKSMAEAFTDAMLAAISTISQQWASFYFAKAAAALGEGFLGNPAGFAAAAKFALAGAAFSALSGITAGLASGGAGLGGTAANSIRDSRDFEGDTRGALTLVLEGDESTFDHNNPKSVDRFARMMEEASGRRVVVRRVG